VKQDAFFKRLLCKIGLSLHLGAALHAGQADGFHALQATRAARRVDSHIRAADNEDLRPDSGSRTGIHCADEIQRTQDTRRVFPRNIQPAVNPGAGSDKYRVKCSGRRIC
jgi:hypothetical protein